MRKHLAGFLLLGLCAARLWGAVPSNSVWILPAAKDQPSRPVTISRFFVQGQIKGCAQAQTGGQPLPSQCDVLTRWPDGSLQHALVTFNTPLAANRALEVSFIDAAPVSDPGLDQDGMLNFLGGAWGASLQATAGGVTYTADARAMLQAGAWRYWMRGPLVTQVIVEGQSDNAADLFQFDFGWQCGGGCTQPYDQAQWAAPTDPKYNSLHPIFVLTFYKDQPGVKVEYILENMWAQKLQDLRYDVVLNAGQPAQQVYAHPGLVHIAKTRWRKVFWSGAPTPDWDSEAQPGIIVNYNLPYLIYSRALPTYDTGITLPLADIKTEVSDFQQHTAGVEPQFCTDRVYCGQWYRYMNTGGARGDIALVPRWYIRYLYSFDPRLYSDMVQDGLASGVVPIHIRESDDSLKFLQDQSVPALGLPLSLDARPMARTFNGGSAPDPTWQPVGTVSCFSTTAFACTMYQNEVWTSDTVNNWKVDVEHSPSMAYIPYLITGDWYFLQELYQWASWTAATGVQGSGPVYSRHGAWGYIEWAGSSRAEAWGLRNLAYPALLAPAGTPESLYYTRLLQNNIAVKEGRQNIRDGAFFEPNPGGSADDPCPAATYNPDTATRWCWGWVTLDQRLDNPLHFAGPGFSNWPGVRKDVALTSNSIWMDNFLRVAYGHLRELGFPTGKLADQQSEALIHQLQDSGYNPYLAFEYMYGSRNLDGSFYRQWADVKNSFITSTTLSADIGTNDTVLSVSGLVNAEGGMRLDPIQTLQIEDELVRICATSLVQTAGVYTGSKLTVCPGGRGAQASAAAAHTAGTAVVRLFREVPTAVVTELLGGYGWVARSAASFAANNSTLDSDGVTTLFGKGAWQWISNATHPWSQLLVDNPTWAIIPRQDDMLVHRPFRSRSVAIEP